MKKLFVSVILCGWAVLAAGPAAAAGPDWDDFLDKLDDNLYREALAVADSIAVQAEADGEAEEWARALVEVTRLHWLLGAHETGAEYLLLNRGPQEAPWRDVVSLYRSHALSQYVQRYGYQIRQKPTVTVLDSLDISTWSLDRLSTEIRTGLAGIWLGRAAWGDRGLDDLSAFVDQNTYPARIRGTLRDAVSYLLAESLVNTALWSPREASGLFRLDLDQLMDGDGPLPDDAAILDTERHPLERLHQVLADLRQWHLAAGRTEASHEAQLELLRLLMDTLEHDGDRRRLVLELETLQADFDAALPWWSFGQWRLAKFIRRQDDPDSDVRARFAAEKGARRHPGSPGGRLCARLTEEIEQPDLQASAMGQDLPGRRSILLTHRNLDRVYLRAWRRESSGPDGFALLLDPIRNHEDLQKLTESTPDLSWEVDLPRTEDYKPHRTHTSLPDCPPGAYLVGVSARSDFRVEDNVRTALPMLVSDLVLQARQLAEAWEIRAVSGTTGRPWPGAELDFVTRTGRAGWTEFAQAETDARGLARISFPERVTGGVVARSGPHAAGVPHLVRGYRGTRSENTRCFLYTDRSVYRPGQTVYWKAVVYAPVPGSDDYRTLPATRLEVYLKDPNRETRGDFEGETNGFGSASGHFVLPADGLLGGWSLQVPDRGTAHIRVEAYKRPTFEVDLDDLAGEPELNRPIRLTGRAGYYFGQPVTEGRVTWVVERVPILKVWRRLPGGLNEIETIAAGTADLAADGTFAVDFTPEADRRLAGEPDVSYRFAVMAEVTNAGGETRTGERSYRLGYAGVEATVVPSRQLYVSGKSADFEVVRTNLDGAPRPGDGSWRIAVLKQPAVTPLPSDLPGDPAPTLTPTPGDSLRARWEFGGFGPRQMRDWSAGETVARGSLTHDAAGRAAVSAAGLAPGAYRLIYDTADARGREVRAEENFIVAGERATPLAMPLVVLAEAPRVAVGDTAVILVHSGLSEQPVYLEVFKGPRRLRSDILAGGRTDGLIRIPVTGEMRGGLSVRASVVRDHQILRSGTPITVPWDNKDLTVEFVSFRDRLTPGADTDFTVHVTGPDARAVAEGTVEVLAYMYDRTLDLFQGHTPPVPRTLFRQDLSSPGERISLDRSRPVHLPYQGFRLKVDPGPQLHPDRLAWVPELYVRGGRGQSTADVLMSLDMPVAETMEVEGAEYMVTVKSAVTEHTVSSETFSQFAIDSVEDALTKQAGVPAHAADPEPPLRENFAPTAFFAPHVTLDGDGTAVIAFKVPDSVTDWNVYAHAFTRDLDSGSAHRTVSSRQDLMVRPYLPRFLREGDTAVLKVLVDNAGETDLSGTVRLSLTDPVTGADVSARFGLGDRKSLQRSCEVPAGQGRAVTFDLSAPSRPGSVVVKVVATAGNLSDGEQHELPVLPGRMHLAQSRFVTLDDADRREMTFPEMAVPDATRIHDQLVVTIDAQLFQGVLAALPYLVDYPYECTEQTLNRYLSTSILTAVFAESPALKAMAAGFADRDTRLPAWPADDPNRKMLLEETPWLARSRGGEPGGDRLLNILDQDNARSQMLDSRGKLAQLQAGDGGFPWMPGGESSPYLTLYVLQGLSRAREFGVEIDGPMAVRAWDFIHRYYRGELLDKLRTGEVGWRLTTFLNYLLSGLDEQTRAETGFTRDDRDLMLDVSFRSWRQHSRLLKGQLALTLARAGRDEDARRVVAAAMDAARTEKDLGTWWAPEERSWLWYNDTVEAHAFMLRVLTELDPDDPRRHGLVKWLFLNRHLGHWKSTRATAEVIYALTHYLRREGTLNAAERITVAIGHETHTLDFEPEVYSGQDNHLVVAGEDVDAGSMAIITVAKDTPGMAFASSTWHFSTERMPTMAEGDLLGVTRRHYRRFQEDGQWKLEPLAEGMVLAVGDQVEVYLDVTAGHPAEFIHLRDPRGAGFEPEELTSGYSWRGGWTHYREIRDSGVNFFFDRVPAGTYALRYRLRATMAGTFRVGPAVLQSMYAPEFTAYSAGKVLEIAP